ncbi:MAG: hypothetical protein JNL21_29370 [Myxococcales bacterium]|nr:hypothetical protein [Myxococcales bacterium]
MRTLEVGTLPYTVWIDLDGPQLAGTVEEPVVVREARGAGIEEWFLFERQPPVEALSFTVDVSQFHALRLVSRVLEFLDEEGTPRLRMAAPWLLDRHGAVHQLSVEVRGCAVDRDPRGPWDRDVLPLDADQCEVEIGWSLAPTAYPVWVDPFWSPTNLMTTPRAIHTATRLPDGRVLVAGGTTDVLPEVETCELYDPGSGTFAATSPLSEAKRAHSAVALDDGRVVVMGGEAGVAVPFASSARVERYDPLTGLWTRLEDLPTTRSGGCLVRLQSGELLRVGGWHPADGAALDVVERCAATGAPCAVVEPMLLPRSGHAGVTLPDGRVFVAGGGENVFDPSAALWSSSEIFDPSSEQWSAGPELQLARFDAAAVVLSDGRLLLAGGSTFLGGAQSTSAALELVDPDAALGQDVGAMTVARWRHSSSLLPNGTVLSAGALGPNFSPSTIVTTEAFDPSSLSSKLTGTLPAPTALHQATLLEDGRVLLTGGFNTTVSDVASVFGDPLGSACVARDPSSCPNGVCVAGICEATFPGPGGGGAGGSGAAGGAPGGTGGEGQVTTGGEGGSARIESADASSFYGCAASAAPAPVDLPFVLLVASTLVLKRLRARASEAPVHTSNEPSLRLRRSWNAAPWKPVQRSGTREEACATPSGDREVRRRRARPVARARDARGVWGRRLGGRWR